MANSIELRKAYTEGLDEVYKLASITARLDGPSDLAREGANANELLIPKIDMDGLADYDKSTGYAAGYVDYEFQTKKITYDRGRRFEVDAVDNMDTLNQAFGRLAGEFMRTKVVPELDSYRLSQYAQKAGGSEEKVIDTGRKAINSLRKAITFMKEHEVDMSDCTLYISPLVKGLIEDLDTLASRKVMEGWSAIIEVPSSRFHTKITLGSNGYTIPDDSKKINFEIISKKAVIQFTKHDVPKIINPEKNQHSDGYMFMYRTVGIAEVYDNKENGVYVCTEPGEAPVIVTGAFDSPTYGVTEGESITATFTYTPNTVQATDITIGTTAGTGSVTVEASSTEAGTITVQVTGGTEGTASLTATYNSETLDTAEVTVSAAAPLISFVNPPETIIQGQTATLEIEYDSSIDPSDITVTSSDDTKIEVVTEP